MKKPVNKRLKYYTLTSVVFLLIPGFYLFYWTYCFSAYTNRNEAVEHFKLTLPNFMRDDGNTNFIFVILAIIAMFFGVKGFKNQKPFWHILSMLIVVTGGLLALLYLFQMM